MEYHDRHDEHNTPSKISLADTVTSHRRWARSIVSPWVQRKFEHRQRPGSAGISAAYTLDRLQRVHHKAYEANAWRPDVGATSPAALQQFAGTIIRRHRSFQDKATARISHPQSDQDTSASLPLAHPSGVRVATESDDSRLSATPTRSSSPSTPAQPAQPPQSSSQSPVRPSPSSHVSPSQSSASESMPPLPPNHPLNTGDVPTKRVQRQPSPSTSAPSSTPSPPSQQPPKRRRIYSRVEEITPGGRMTNESASPSESSAEPAPSSEQSVHKVEDTDVATEPAAAPDDPSTADSDEDSGGAVQRTAREVTPASPTQPKSADSDSTSAPRRQDSQQTQQPASPTQTRDTSSIQRTPDNTERAASLPSESQPDEAIRLSEEPRTPGKPGDDVDVSNDIQRNLESSEKDMAPAAPQPDDEVQMSEEPQAGEGSTDDVETLDDIQKKMDSSERESTPASQPAEPPTLHEERSPDQPQQVSTSESPLETQSPQESSDATIQRREHQPESAESEPAASSQPSAADTDVASEMAQPAADRDEIPGDVDDTEAPTSPAEKAQPSSVQRTPDDASERHPPKENREDVASSEQPPAPTTADQFKDETDQINVSELPVTSAKEAGNQPPSGDDIAQRTWDTPATQPSQRPAEPAPERPTDANDTQIADSIETPTTTSREPEAPPPGRESDDVESVEQSVTKSTTEEPVEVEPQLQRSSEHDAGQEPASPSDTQQPAKEPVRTEQSVEPDTPTTPEEPPTLSSAKPEASTEIERSADESSRIQRQHRYESISLAEKDSESTEPEPAPPVESDPGVETPSVRQDTTASDEAPASVQRAPELTDERADTEPIQDDLQTPDRSDEQSIVQSEEAPTSTEPASTHETDQSIQRTELQEHRPPSTEPSEDTTNRRSPEHDVSDETVVQRQAETPDTGSDAHASGQPFTAESHPDDDTQTLTFDDSTPAEPTQRSTVDERTVSEDLPQSPKDAPVSVEEPAIQQTEAEQLRDTSESPTESARVQRTSDDSTTIQSSDIGREQHMTSESEAPSEPASPTQQGMSQHETPASDEVGPTVLKPESGEQTGTAPARDVQSTQPQLRAQIQREPDDDGESTATASDAMPARRANTGPQSEPASPSKETLPSDDDTISRAHVQHQADYPSSPDASDTMPLADPRSVPPAKPKQDHTPTDSTIQRKSGGNVSAPTVVQAEHRPATRTGAPSAPGDRSPASSEPDSGQRRRLQRDEPDSASVHAVGVATDAQYAIRKAPASDHSPASSELPPGSLEQTLVSRAESRSRLPLATQHTIRRKPVSPSDDLSISQPTQVIRRVRTQFEARRPGVDETIERSNERIPRTQQQPMDDDKHAQVPEPSQVAETKSEPPVDSLAPADLQPAPQVSPPVFTPAARTPDTTLIQRTPLEFVQRVPSPIGSEVKQEPASETTSEFDEEERDEEQEINLDRLARDVYPLIKRMIAIERERRPGR